MPREKLGKNRERKKGGGGVGGKGQIKQGGVCFRWGGGGVEKYPDADARAQGARGVGGGKGGEKTKLEEPAARRPAEVSLNKFQQQLGARVEGKNLGKKKTAPGSTRFSRLFARDAALSRRAVRGAVTGIRDT